MDKEKEFKVVSLRAIRIRKKFSKITSFIQPFLNLFTQKANRPCKSKYQYRKPVNH